MRIQISSWDDYLKWREGFVGLKKVGEERPDRPNVGKHEDVTARDMYEAAAELMRDLYKEPKPSTDQGIKESEGKLFYELDWNFITQMAERMSTNDKYPVFNWKKPMDVEELKQALFRHVLEVMKGNYEDDGREFGHIEAVATNCFILNYQLKIKDGKDL